MYRDRKLNEGGSGTVFYLSVLRLLSIDGNAVKPGTWWNDRQGIKIE
jgi:hypothetical protein